MRYKRIHTQEGSQTVSNACITGHVNKYSFIENLKHGVVIDIVCLIFMSIIHVAGDAHPNTE